MSSTFLTVTCPFPCERLMVKLDRRYPLYGFATHKGGGGLGFTMDDFKRGFSVFMSLNFCCTVRCAWRFCKMLSTVPGYGTAGHQAGCAACRILHGRQRTAIPNLFAMDRGFGKRKEKVIRIAGWTFHSPHLIPLRSRRVNGNVIQKCGVVLCQPPSQLQAALIKHGPCAEHRTSFEPIKAAPRNFWPPGTCPLMAIEIQDVAFLCSKVHQRCSLCIACRPFITPTLVSK